MPSGANRPGSASRKGRSSGRVTTKGTVNSGRYTPPIPKSDRTSPRWYGWMVLAIIGLGLVMIVLNYAQALPGAPTGWYVGAGMVTFLIGLLLAMRWR